MARRWKRFWVRLRSIDFFVMVHIQFYSSERVYSFQDCCFILSQLIQLMNQKISGIIRFNPNQLPSQVYNNMHKPISKPSNSSINLNKFNYHSMPAPDLRLLLQQPFTIRSLEISPHGKSGVIFIETNRGSFVLKSNNQGPTDEFLNRMAALLQLNVPQSICFTCSDMIFHKLVFEIEKFCQRDEVLYARMKNRLDFPFYQVLEYVPSISLAEVGKDRFEKYLTDQRKLIQIGMCIGFDLITNNSDRFKLLWGGDGNINNVLIEVRDYESHALADIRNRGNQTVGLDNYVFIDHSGYLLDLKDELAAQNFERFMTKVCNFQTDLVRSLSQEYPTPKQFNRLKQQILLYTHYELTSSDLTYVSKGIVFVTNKFLDIFQSRVLQELYRSMQKQVSEGQTKKDKENNYWGQYWNDTLKKINLKYLEEVFAKMAAIYTTYPEIIHKNIAEVEEQVTPKNTQFTDMDNHPVEYPPPQLAYSHNGSNYQQTPPNEPDKNNKISQKDEQSQNPSKGKASDRPESKHSKEPSEHSRKSMLSNKDLFAQMKQRKWRQKLVKYRQDNANHKELP